MSQVPVRLPDVAVHWGRVTVDDVARDDLHMALCGLYAPGARYLEAGERESVRSRGRLPDGTWWDLPLALPLPLSSSAQPGERLVLVDAEGVPQAFLDVSEVSDDDDGRLAAGQLVPAREVPAGPRFHDRPVVVAVTEPLDEDDVTQVAQMASDTKPVAIVALTGAGQPHSFGTLRGALGEAAGRLGAPIVPLPLPCHTTLTETSRARLAARVAAAMGAGSVVLPGTSWTVGVGADVPVAVRVTTTSRRGPQRRRGGLVVMFTGLSGSGKSTIARAVVDELGRRSGRPVTLLDGDLVRRMLSSELGFSREHRDLNVRRIGFVAAEIARHGGLCVAAPIAPYATTRAEVRTMVERHSTFVLVHVATPLEVCEARDRKGLYALARAGRLEAFTGVDDVYEPPSDAELVLDTTTRSVEDCTAAVMTLVDQWETSWT